MLLTFCSHLGKERRGEASYVTGAELVMDGGYLAR